MDKIKTPVRYNADAQIVWTADNVHLCDIRGYGYLTGTGGLHLSDQLANAIQDSWGRQIANALNNAADQSRVIEMMRTALEQYGEKDFWCPREDGEDNDGADWWLGSTDGYTPALDALAEARRIMEGK